MSALPSLILPNPLFVRRLYLRGQSEVRQGSDHFFYAWGTDVTIAAQPVDVSTNGTLIDARAGDHVDTLSLLLDEHAVASMRLNYFSCRRGR